MVEVVARIGDSIIDVTHVAPGASYKLGTVALATHPTDTLVQQRVGLVAITMTRTFRVDNAVARRRLEWKPICYAVASLAVHLMIWGAAIGLAPFERLRGQAGAAPQHRYVHVLPQAPEPEPKPEPKPEQKPDPKTDPKTEAKPSPEVASETDTPKTDQPTERNGRSEPADAGPKGHAAALASASAAANEVASQIAAIDVKGRLANLGPAYDEDEANAKGFGGGLRMQRPGSVATGDYGTVSTGVGAGEFYDPFDKSDPAEKAAQKAKNRIIEATAMAGKSARRGDCVPAHRIARMVKRLDMALYRSMYTADPDIAYCLTQPLPPKHISLKHLQQ
jgi:hypothetical protein